MMNVYYFEWQKCQYIPDLRFYVSQVSVKVVVHGTQIIWFISSTILFEYTQEESSHNTVKVFGGVCPGALSSPIEVKRSVITFMSLFVFVLVFRFILSSNKNHQFLHLLPYETFCLVRHFLSDCRNPRSGLLTNLWVSSVDQVQRTLNLGFQFQIYSLTYHLLPFLTDRRI
jgi:hypothetical protein